MSEAAIRRCSSKYVFLKIPQNSKENTCVRVSFLMQMQINCKFSANQLTGFYMMGPATLLKKRLWHRCFPVNFAKFLRTLFFYRPLRVAASVMSLCWKPGWNVRLLTLSCIMLKNCQSYFKSLAVFTPQNFKRTFCHFST